MISTNPNRKIPAKNVIRAARKVIRHAISEASLICGWSPWSGPMFLRIASPMTRLNAASGRTASLLVLPRTA
jgi:hypothetical protein